MSLQLLADSDIALASLEAVDGADVVETTTGHKAARRCVSTGHDPAGSQGDSMDLYTGGRERVKTSQSCPKYSHTITNGYQGRILTHEEMDHLK